MRRKIGYLIPYDGSMDKICKNLTMAEIRDTISRKLPAKHVFYVMDACYSGLLTTRSADGKTRRDCSRRGSVNNAVRSGGHQGGKAGLFGTLGNRAAVNTVAARTWPRDEMNPALDSVTAIGY